MKRTEGRQRNSKRAAVAVPAADRPRLRAGLEVARTGPRSFALLDPNTRALLTLDLEERAILLRLQRGTFAVDPARGPSPREAGLLDRLRREGMLEEGPRPAEAPALTPAPAPLREPAPAAVPAAVPEPSDGLNFAFDVLVMLFGWILHPIWVFPILAMTAIGANAVFRHWGQFTADLGVPWRTYSFPLLLAASLFQTYLLVNLPRSLLVGMACRKFGGRVVSLGPELIEGVLPTIYCNFGESAWRMGTRGRLTMLSVDSWLQILVASAASILWSTAPGKGFGIFWGFMVAPSLGGLLLNSLIFYKFGGYWVLCVTLNLVDFRERALAETHAWLAFRPSPEPLTDKRRFWFRAYGLGYYVCRVVCDSILMLGGGYFLTTRFGQPGAVAFVMLVCWYYRPTLRRVLMAIPTIRWALRRGGPWWLRWPSRLLLLAGVAWLGFLPYNYEIAGECRLLPREQVGVRAQIADEIAEIRVAEGDHVEPGQVLATLVGRDARSHVKTTAAALEAARAQLDELLKQPYAEDVTLAAELLRIRETQLSYRLRVSDRTEKLYAQSVAKTEDLDRDTTARDDARIAVVMAAEALKKAQKGPHEEDIRAAEAKIENLEYQLVHDKEVLALTTLTSPIRGTIVTPYMEHKPGQQTHAGSLVAIVQDKSSLRAEMAADDSAVVDVREGQRVKIRLRALTGQQITGRVRKVAPAIESAGKFDNDPVRTDTEGYSEEATNSRVRNGNYQVRVYIDLDPSPYQLAPEMTGYARIVIGDDELWRCLARPIVRYLRTEVWYWLP